MKILMVNKFHFLNGGAELYYFGLSDLLRARGHAIHYFSMQHPENVPCDDARYFIDNINYENPAGLPAKLRIAAHTVYSAEARRKIASLLDAVPVDLVHLHNFHHQITPSILPEIKRRGIPIVFTVHDYKVICPNYKLLTHDGVCERCRGHRYYQCTLHRCTKGALLSSVVNTVEMYAHRWLGYNDLYDVFSAPSQFMADKLVEFGIPRERVRYIPNFVDIDRYQPQFTPGPYLLYLGRLSQEKGVQTLIEATKRLPHIPFKVTGRGPFEEPIRRMVHESSSNNIELTGHLAGDALRETIQNAMAIIIPSEWYENCPLSLIEAYAYGKPVIAARIGGLRDMVLDGQTGFHFESGNVDALATIIEKAASNPAQLQKMGRFARNYAETEYGKDKQYERITTIYSALRSS